MDPKETEIICRAENYIRRTAAMIGQENAKNLLEVIHLAKKQSVELSLYRNEENADHIILTAELISENNDLKRFKEKTEEIVGEIILELIEERMAE